MLHNGAAAALPAFSRSTTFGGGGPNPVGLPAPGTARLTPGR